MWGFWLVEIKSLFSIAFLSFHNGSRDAYHEHAFNACSWVLRGELFEKPLGRRGRWHLPSWRPVWTRRSMCHRVVSFGTTWVLTFRGPWATDWREYLPKEDRFVKLGHGRVIVD